VEMKMRAFIMKDEPVPATGKSARQDSVTASGERAAGGA
jgi:hypothetical protein